MIKKDQASMDGDTTDKPGDILAHFSRTMPPKNVPASTLKIPHDLSKPLITQNTNPFRSKLDTSGLKEERSGKGASGVHSHPPSPASSQDRPRMFTLNFQEARESLPVPKDADTSDFQKARRSNPDLHSFVVDKPLPFNLNDSNNPSDEHRFGGYNLSKLKGSFVPLNQSELEDEKSLNMKIQMLNGMPIEDELRAPLGVSRQQISPLVKEIPVIVATKNGLPPGYRTSIDSLTKMPMKGGQIEATLFSPDTKEQKAGGKTVQYGHQTLSTAPATLPSQTHLQVDSSKEPANPKRPVQVISWDKQSKDKLFHASRTQSVNLSQSAFNKSSTSIRRLVREAKDQSPFNNHKRFRIERASDGLKASSFQSGDRAGLSLSQNRTTPLPRDLDASRNPDRSHNRPEGAEDPVNPNHIFEASLRAEGPSSDPKDKRLAQLRMKDAQRKHFFQFDQAVFNNKLFDD
jgi:hypothetical protein